MTEQPTLDDHLAELAEARARRDQGQTQAVHALHPAWRVAADAVIDELVAAGVVFTADDVRERVGHALGREHTNALGGLFAAACRAGRIVPVGYRQSARADARGRVLRAWRGTEREGPQ